MSVPLVWLLYIIIAKVLILLIFYFGLRCCVDIFKVLSPLILQLEFDLCPSVVANEMKCCKTDTFLVLIPRLCFPSISISIFLSTYFSI
ncbi:hypothetical protein E1A91_A05G048600v1 [Gossypium mustelinum]|uniref:Uncharacterized protein n=1 Tax=Gossypium mustelinum TaxID=34275 RepID=A0A5D2Z3P9_GOSMU|nr:hypothetical protein E1A91_A05G048600v1 [Gossypium mustelinum]